MMKEMPGLPKICLPIVDVRDVAQAHLMALKVPEAANKRFMLVSESCFFSKLGEDLDEIYG
jgi:dihydroflavonol-4-reductase